MAETSKILSGEGQFTDALAVRGLDPVLGEGRFDVAVSGTFVGTISLQASFDGGSTWLDTGDEITTPGIETSSGMATDAHVRAGFKTGGYTSGSATVRIRR